MHPQLVSSAYSDIQLFKSLFGESYYIGEVGLDFSKEYVQTRKAQIEIFTEIIRLCEQYGGKVVSIHSLKAANTVIDILKKYKRKTNNKYIFHWFTGSIAQLEKAIEIGCYFSINPGMLKTKSGLEIIKKVPLDRILVETDAPFALKVKNMDGIEQELNRIVSKISDVVGQNMCDIVHENSIEVFSRIEV